MALLRKELRYKQEGRGFDSRWCPGRILWPWGSTQPLAEMTIVNISWEVKAVGA